MRLRRVFLVFCLIPFVFTTPFSKIRLKSNNVNSIEKVQWWEFASFYRIYVRSFKDSNGDGIGDLNGITENLSYLKELGITAACISSIFKSSKGQSGEEVFNYFEIHDEYGNMNDFYKMMKKANELDIKIILDLNPIYSSDQNEWFKYSVKTTDPKFENFYISQSNSTNLTISSNSDAWKPNDQSTYGNQIMENIFKFWLEKGVYGFYIYFEYYKTSEFVYKWRKMLDDFTQQSENKIERIMIIEDLSPIDEIMKYYGSRDGKKQGAQIPFNYLLGIKLSKLSNAKDFVNIINTWIKKMPHGKSANWATGNLLFPRAHVMFGVEKIDIMNMILLSLPGASITYYGEEIGMTDLYKLYTDGLGQNKQQLKPQQTPFQWTDEKNAGFSIADRIWCPIAPNYRDVNVGRQRSIARSTLNIYKEMQRLRKTNTFVNNNMQIKALSDNVLAIVRSTEEQGTLKFIILVNLSKEWEIANLSELKGISDNLEYVLVNDNSPRRIGDTTSKNIKLFPFEGVILKSTALLI